MLRALFSIGIFIIMSCVFIFLIAWLRSKSESLADNINLPLDSIYKGPVSLKYQEYVSISKLSSSNIVESKKITDVPRIYYNHENYYWLLKLSLPAYIYHCCNFGKKKELQNKISFLEAVRKDAKAEKKKYLEAIEKAENIINKIVEDNKQ